MARHLVDRRRAEPAAGSQRLQQRAVVEQRRQAVSARVPEIRAHRLAPVLGDDRRKAVGHDGPRFLPVHLHVHPVALHEGQAQAVGVVVQLLERAALGADEAATEDVGLVAADACDPLGRWSTLDGDLQPTTGFAQRAGAECCARDLAGVVVFGPHGWHPLTNATTVSAPGRRCHPARMLRRAQATAHRAAVGVAVHGVGARRLHRRGQHLARPLQPHRPGLAADPAHLRRGDPGGRRHRSRRGLRPAEGTRATHRHHLPQRRVRLRHPPVRIRQGVPRAARRRTGGASAGGACRHRAARHRIGARPDRRRWGTQVVQAEGGATLNGLLAAGRPASTS